ncbi:MAG: hypothetical protein DWQ36_07315 [Acidobacteria bacterium]|nr:MAG: hypothetical protein DWQ30_23285 [Acidobacteriota bacterium]REK09347.1 MAG: hypothetical protein DWQ36_07315 [Acidobacteriota bacterium]
MRSPVGGSKSRRWSSAILGLLSCTLAIAVPASAETRTFRGAGSGEPPWDGLRSSWVRPAVGGLPAAPAFWESTSFYVTESAEHSLASRVDLHSEPQPVAFPRVLMLYSHAFDPNQPAKNLVATLDLSDGREVGTADWPLIANNMYHLVLSTVDEDLPLGAEGHLLGVDTTISGPGAIARNYCRFTDDVSSDADGFYWNQEAAMAKQRGPVGREQICISVSYTDTQGTRQTARVAPQRTLDSVLFYFFEEKNWEINAKLLDACDINGRYWLLASASTDVEFELRVRFLGYDAFVSPASPYFEPFIPGEPLSGGELVYRSDGGEPAQTIIDVDAVVCEQ